MSIFALLINENGNTEFCELKEKCMHPRCINKWTELCEYKGCNQQRCYKHYRIVDYEGEEMIACLWCMERMAGSE